MPPGRTGSALIAGSPVHGGGKRAPEGALPSSCWALHASSVTMPATTLACSTWTQNGRKAQLSPTQHGSQTYRLVGKVPGAALPSSRAFDCSSISIYVSQCTEHDSLLIGMLDQLARLLANRVLCHMAHVNPSGRQYSALHRSKQLKVVVILLVDMISNYHCIAQGHQPVFPKVPWAFVSWRNTMIEQAMLSSTCFDYTVIR